MLLTSRGLRRSSISLAKSIHIAPSSTATNSLWNTAHRAIRPGCRSSPSMKMCLCFCSTKKKRQRCRRALNNKKQKRTKHLSASQRRETLASNGQYVAWAPSWLQQPILRSLHSWAPTLRSQPKHLESKQDPVCQCCFMHSRRQLNQVFFCAFYRTPPRPEDTSASDRKITQPILFQADCVPQRLHHFHNGAEIVLAFGFRIYAVEPCHPLGIQPASGHRG